MERERVNDGESTTTNAEPHKEFKLVTSFQDIHLGKFVGISSAVYLAENVVYYPFDVLRTRLQVSRGQFSYGASLNLAKQLGMKGLFRGYWSSSIGALPPHALYFLSYNYFKDILQDFHNSHYKRSSNHVEGKQAFWVSITAGGLADLASNFLVVPYEVVVQRIQIQDTNSVRYKGGIDVVKSIWRSDGIKGFYKGFGATLLAYAPGSAIWWGAYEQSKSYFCEILTQREHPDQMDNLIVSQHTSAQIAAGAVAGISTSILTNPMDVVKTRIQTQDQMAASNKKIVLYKNSWDAAKQMLKSEGWKVFGKGIGPKLFTSTLFSSWFGFAYELILEHSRKGVT